MRTVTFSGFGRNEHGEPRARVGGTVATDASADDMADAIAGVAYGITPSVVLAVAEDGREVATADRLKGDDRDDAALEMFMNVVAIYLDNDDDA